MNLGDADIRIAICDDNDGKRDNLHWWHTSLVGEPSIFADMSER